MPSVQNLTKIDEDVNGKIVTPAIVEGQDIAKKNETIHEELNTVIIANTTADVSKNTTVVDEKINKTSPDISESTTYPDD